MNKSILIIDDDEEDQIIVRDALEEARVDVITYSAKSGQAGLALLEELEDSLPSLILLDFNMPGMNGIEVLKRIREKYSIPVFIHSSGCNEQLREDAKSEGAIDCIKKGGCRDELIETIKLIEETLQKA